MLSVRVASALARTLPRRAGFVSILIIISTSDGNVAASESDICGNLVGVKGTVKAAS